MNYIKKNIQPLTAADSFHESILKVVLYFDIFNYPVTDEEIKSFLDQPYDDAHFCTALHHLVNSGLLFRFDKFYSAKNDASCVEYRINGNNAAVKQLKKAKKVSAFISSFPYIKGIAVSGSLSKNFAYKKSDIDFFIITAANRLWLARTFFMTFYKIAAVFGFKNWFCLNYFIDETALEIEEKNIFTATEIVTLLPCYNDNLFEKFFLANRWTYDYFPNYALKTGIEKKDVRFILKRCIEWLLNNRFGEKLDNAVMSFFSKRWKRLRAKNEFTNSGFKKGCMVAGKHFCKPYPQHFQQKILSCYSAKLQAIKDEFAVSMQV